MASKAKVVKPPPRRLKTRWANPGHAPENLISGGRTTNIKTVNSLENEALSINMSHILRFKSSGHIDCLYTEVIDLHALGRLKIVRATVILFCEKSQEWKVRCASTGKLLLSNPSRESCLAWELQNLQPGTE